MKKENKKFLVGIIATILVVSVIGTLFFGGKALGWWGAEAAAKQNQNQPQTTVTCGDGVCHLPEYNAGSCPADCGGAIANQAAPTASASGGLVYVDLYGNLMDKSKFATDSSNAYAGLDSNQSVKFYDITKNPQNDPRTNILAVADFQIVSTGAGTDDGALTGTKKGIAGHTYVYYFENTSGMFYDVTGTFTIPANINAFAPAFDFGNILAPKVGTLYTYNESSHRTDNANYHENFTGAAHIIRSSTQATDLQVRVGSQTYAEFVRIWGEWSSTSMKAAVIGVTAVQKAGPSTGVTIDSSDEKNPIITVNELTAQFPLTFTYYVQGAASQVNGSYMIYVDDWNAVPGKFATKIDALVGLFDDKN